MLFMASPTRVITMLVLCAISQAASIERTKSIDSLVPSLGRTFKIARDGGLTQFVENCYCPLIEDLVLSVSEPNPSFNAAFESPEFFEKGMAAGYSALAGYKSAMPKLWKDYDEVMTLLVEATCRQTDSTPEEKSVQFRMVQALVRVLHGSIAMVFPPATEHELESLSIKMGAAPEHRTLSNLWPIYGKGVIEEVKKLAANRQSGVTAVYKVIAGYKADGTGYYEDPVRVWPTPYI